ncbi:MAG TPA: response regulator transcription factor [Candidatus Limnocylindria bacterium]|nr:response regulator transcription factor [Candidatus Limnocylindria bacterium]
MKALLADGDVDHLDLLSYALRRDGYIVVTAVDAPQALSRWESEQPDVVILAADLEKGSGDEVCRVIRRTSATPVILHAEVENRQRVIAGLDSGADDFLRRPFDVGELLARMRAVLRRHHGTVRRDISELHVADIVLDLESHQARYEHKSAQLTALEFGILSLLMMNPGRIVPMRRLVQYAWGSDTGGTQVLKPHVSHIRRKLGLPSEGPGAIRSVSSVGYQIVVPPAHQEADQRKTQSQVSLRLLSSNASVDGTASV